MKTKRLTWTCASALALTLGTATPGFAYEESQPLAVITDTVVIRPACLAATVIGSAFFVVSLPVAVASKSVKKTANTLVVKPAKATFTRPLGNMDALRDDPYPGSMTP